MKIDTIVMSIAKHTFGGNTKVIEYKIITDKVFNTSLKVRTNQFEKPIFLKLEKDFQIPRTQKNQIRREIKGIMLCKDKGISVPAIISSDETGNICGYPWILVEFIEGKLIGEYNIGDENKSLLGREFEAVFERLLSIENGLYGDTVEISHIGQHKTWKEAISQIMSILLQDCTELEIFDDSSLSIIKQATEKALSFQKCITKPVLFHSDLFSVNVFAIERNDQVHLGSIIDFGMSLFAPLHYTQYQTRRYTDFLTSDMNVTEIYGVDKNELDSYDILRIEPVVLANIFQRTNNSFDASSITQEYIRKCHNYIS